MNKSRKNSEAEVIAQSSNDDESEETPRNTVDVSGAPLLEFDEQNDDEKGRNSSKLTTSIQFVNEHHDSDNQLIKIDKVKPSLLEIVDDDSRQSHKSSQNILSTEFDGLEGEVESGNSSSFSAASLKSSNNQDEVTKSSQHKNVFLAGNNHQQPQMPATLPNNQCLHYRLRRAIHPDTMIVIGHKEFPCHGIALQTYSQYFDSMKRPTETIHRIHIPENIIKPQEFPNLMDWILLDDTAKPLIINKNNVVQLYAAANYLGIQRLKEHCKQFINDKLGNGDPLTLRLYEEARKRNCKELKSCLASKFADVFPFVYKSNKFLSLGLEELIMLIDSDDVRIQSELDIYDVTARWLLHDWSNRHREAVKIMSHVRFGLLSPLQLTQILHCADASSTMPDYSRIFSFSEIKDMVHDGLSYAIFRENYDSRPEEFNKWIDWSQVHCPRPRHNVHPDPKINKNMSASFELSEKNFIDADEDKQSENVSQRKGKQNVSKAAVFDENSEIHTSHIDQQPTSANLKPHNGGPRRRSSLLENPFTMASILRVNNNSRRDQDKVNWRQKLS